MKHRKIATLMTTDVAVVRPDTPFKQVARTLEQRGISGVPVVDARYRVLGVVSAADLLPKESLHEPPGLVARLVRSRRRRGWSKARATAAADLMTTPAITVGFDADVVQAAKLMDQHKITRLPVVDGDGQLAGIVACADLLRVFLRPDTAIATEIRHEVFERELGLTIAPATVTVLVREGVVTLSGQLEYRSQIPAAVALARRVDGVVAVVDELTWHLDDRHAELVAPDTTDVIATVRRAIR